MSLGVCEVVEVSQDSVVSWTLACPMGGFGG